MRRAAGLLAQAEAVLRGNDVGGSYTRPSPRLYPHQWNWDSAFAAIGWAYVDWPRAVREIETLLRGQWTDGMVPHIRYNPDAADYAPGPEWWPDVPVRARGEATSGISQPYVLASAAYLVGLLAPDGPSRRAFWARVYDRLLDGLLYFPRRRTVGDSPLIVVVHPWESGLDNSPRWDFATDLGYRPGRPYHRGDVTVVDPALRPSGKDYDLYLYLVELWAACRYELRAFLPQTPFAVYDALFNAAWYRSALDLNRIARALGRPPAVGAPQLRAFREAYHRTLWDEESALYLDWDVRGGQPISAQTLAGLIAIYGGLVEPHAASEMVRRYRERSRGCAPLPSVPPDQPGFDPVKYWRGPAWVNMNWMIARGLEEAGLRREAMRLAEETVDLVARAGFHEYFDARTGAGIGGGEFTWSAALVIDLLRRPIRA
jgi:hypothetical protein